MTTGTSYARESRCAPQLSSAPLPLSSDSDRPGPGLVTGNTRASHPATRPHHGRRAPLLASRRTSDVTPTPPAIPATIQTGPDREERQEASAIRETSKAVSPGKLTCPPSPTRTHGTSAGTGAPGAASTRAAREGSEHARAPTRQREGIAGVGQIGRGQAHEGDRAADTFDDCVHPSTVRRHTRERLPARAPLWTTPTRNATLCIVRSDGGPCG